MQCELQRGVWCCSSMQTTARCAVTVVALVVLAHTTWAAIRHRGRITKPQGEFECLDTSDCGPARCCVVSPIRYSYPVCSDHGQKGATCRPTAQPFNTSLSYPDGAVVHVSNVHYIMCTCAHGLECQLGTCLEPPPAHEHNSLEEDV